MRAPESPIEVLTGFDSTYLPGHDVDVAETTGHARRWRQDLELVAACGVRRLRYPVRWHRIERRRRSFDWEETDRVLGYLRDHDLHPIVDLLHHTSYPRWLRLGLADRRFAGAYVAFVDAFARRYPWVGEYTLCNEPFTTSFLCGHEGRWPPYLRGVRGFVAVAANLLPALAEASRICAELLPGARHVWVDTCERASATEEAQPWAELANDRRWFLLDAFLGRPLAHERPFVAQVVAAGGSRLLELQPGRVDVVGLDYYAHNQWHYLDASGRAARPSPEPAPLAELMVEAFERYRRPCLLAETNIRGFASDRATWLRYTLEQCEIARARGVPVEGHCWFPFVDSCDWDSILTRAAGHLDPVGVYWLDAGLSRRPSSMSAAYALAAAGHGSSDLPAYRLQPPVDAWLSGWSSQMAHWDWDDPPQAEVVAPLTGGGRRRGGARRTWRR
ncbi:MAG: family 1 glycosylhydrolase [Actinomycetota bacterium]|nr:family 1 glycosylhydrolase [Actinomycetota bacterium]